MCGFVVSNLKNKNKIKKAIDIIQHRGNDSLDFLEYNDLYFAHRRLAITGGENISQPFENDNYIMMYNGEIYDYEDIKNNINYNFKTDGDGEVIFALLNTYGISENFWEKLNGEFAIVIFDKNKKMIYLIRDRMGVKPIYYAMKNGEIIITSEQKAFTAFLDLELDKFVLNQKLSMQYHQPNKSIFKEIKSVEPSTIVTIDLNTMSENSYEYWRLFKTLNKDTNRTPDIYKLIELAVKRRVLNKKVAVCLSGGIDSAIINYFVKKYAREYKCFSIAFTDNDAFNELKDIQKINIFFKNPNKIIKVNTRMLLENFEEALFFSEDFSINLHNAAKLILFKEIKKEGFDITVSGEGSDELFLGYSHFLEDLNINGNPIVQGLHVANGPVLFEKNLQKLNINNHWIKAKLSQGYRISELINSKLEPLFLSQIEQRKDLPIVLESSFLWAKYALNTYILSALGDKLEMASTIEGRVPFLDLDLLNSIDNISVDERINCEGEKIILKNIFKGKLPDIIIKKKKHPFIASPIDFKDDFTKMFFLDKIPSLEKLGFCNIEQIEKIIKMERNEYGSSILFLISVALINERFCGIK